MISQKTDLKFLFYIAKVYSIPIIAPLIQQLKDINLNFACYVSEKVNRQLPDNWPKERIITEIPDAIDYCPDYVLVPGNFVDYRIPGRRVQIFHGLGVEKKSHYKIRHFFDFYCTSGPFVTERFNHMQIKHRYFLVRETGWPKVDYILNYPTGGLKERLNVPGSRKVILYAPTFSSKMQSASDLMSVIPDTIRDNEIWFVKFHELMDKELIDKFLKEVPDSVRLITDYDITPYLHVSDVLISDTSSVVYEFMILNKPVITYRTQSRLDKGINIQTPDELRDSLDRCLMFPDEFQANREKHLNEVNPYLDGKICQRLIDTLIHMQSSDWPKKKKPFNGFRRLQILYHEKFKKGYLR